VSSSAPASLAARDDVDDDDGSSLVAAVNVDGQLNKLVAALVAW
jgi:hypothetical protein